MVALRVLNVGFNCGENMKLLAAIGPFSPDEMISNRTTTFSNVWLWPILLIALAFVSYLCVDAWITHRRNRRIKELKRRARNATLANSIRN
jgi:peptidoglycan/LPS O-acetylase OafA/YrhL